MTDKPDLKLRVDVAVEVMGWVRAEPDKFGNRWIAPNGGNYPEDGDHPPPFELSLDASREVLAEIERRGLRLRFAYHLAQIIRHDDPSLIEAYLTGVWDGTMATAKQQATAALATVRESKATKDV